MQRQKRWFYLYENRVTKEVLTMTQPGQWNLELTEDWAHIGKQLFDPAEE